MIASFIEIIKKVIKENINCKFIFNNNIVLNKVMNNKNKKEYKLKLFFSLIFLFIHQLFK